MNSSKNKISPILLSTYTYKSQRSSFMSYLYKINTEEDITSLYHQLKEEHTKSNHICYAAIVGSNTFIKHDGEGWKSWKCAVQYYLPQQSTLTHTHNN